ncbi:Kunitz/Bovine pancreatic trypsin inhibitor domain protein [Ancylostoma duodenale]|uniref:Kunitz/Bovine pancreatic trypsin inhibitor domain protein n=1 Tax=Ancylostoma duodenale TaxID=51022 RepID=A0A0C2FCK1_9BILA|nr:Kunitz/Bovine pancreatic trypsin inhibitor domain protein [Ancylostoma duodenale]
MKALALFLLWAATATALLDICKEEIKTGNCRASFRKFGYDRCTNKCIPYTYGGCGGSNNMFDTLAECQEKCGKPEDRCSKPLERGICLASMKRYGYDTSSKKCKAFIYGGCGGNDNNFETMAECRETCNDNSSEEESIPDACLLSSEVGPCKGSERRVVECFSFYFDQKSGKCKKFVFGGCGGNGNNFMTKAKCLEACSKHTKPEIEQGEFEVDLSAPKLRMLGNPLQVKLAETKQNSL